MAAKISDDVLNDAVAVSLAQIIAAANQRARELGVDAAQSTITISQRSQAGSAVWRINYGVKDVATRRGGDLIVDVNPADCSIVRVLRGQ